VAFPFRASGHRPAHIGPTIERQARRARIGTVRQRCLLADSLRASAARTWETLVQSVGSALQAITPTDALNWFCHCGDMCS